MSFQPPDATDETVFAELVMIGYLCGYTDQPPKTRLLPEIMKRCISLGPQGYGLALYALIVALSGGTMPFYVVYPVPFGYVGRIEGMWIIDAEKLLEEDIIQEQGFYTSTVVKRVEIENRAYKLEHPEAFGVVIAYRDEDDQINYRCFLIQHTDNANYPWISIIPSDKAVAKMIKMAVKGETSIPAERYFEFIEKYGVEMPRKEEKTESATDEFEIEWSEE